MLVILVSVYGLGRFAFLTNVLYLAIHQKHNKYDIKYVKALNFFARSLCSRLFREPFIMCKTLRGLVGLKH